MIEKKSKNNILWKPSASAPAFPEANIVKVSDVKRRLHFIKNASTQEGLDIIREEEKVLDLHILNMRRSLQVLLEDPLHKASNKPRKLCPNGRLPPLTRFEFRGTSTSRKRI